MRYNVFIIFYLFLILIAPACKPVSLDEAEVVTLAVARNGDWFDSWNQLSIGDDIDYVSKLLGKPSFRPFGFEDDTFYYVSRVGYRRLSMSEFLVLQKSVNAGVLAMDDASMIGINFPIFRVDFEDHKITRMIDAFGGGKDQGGDMATCITNGVPSVPELINVLGETAAFPRYMDIRWMPSVGRYPVKYEVEISVYGYEENSSFIRKYTRVTDHSSLTQILPGRNRYEVRVRATNEEGTSPWSDTVAIKSLN